MTKARIQPLVEPLAEPLASHMAKLIPKGMPAPNLFLSVARNAPLFGFLVESGLIGPTGLLDRCSMPSHIRETVILRTCVATGNDYEFNLHVQTISERMGLTTHQISDVKNYILSPEKWSPQAISATQVVDELISAFTVSDQTYKAGRQHFSEEDLIDITQLVGLYAGVAMMVGLIRPELDRYNAGPLQRTTA